jgi:hypothetical protein
MDTNNQAPAEGDEDYRRALRIASEGRRFVNDCTHLGGMVYVNDLAWALGILADRAAPQPKRTELMRDAGPRMEEGLREIAQRFGHVYWGAGEADCPSDIKAPNGELFKLRCKKCGEDNPVRKWCAVTDPASSQPEHTALDVMEVVVDDTIPPNEMHVILDEKVTQIVKFTNTDHAKHSEAEGVPVAMPTLSPTDAESVRPPTMTVEGVEYVEAPEREGCFECQFYSSKVSCYTVNLAARKAFGGNCGRRKVIYLKA